MNVDVSLTHLLADFVPSDFADFVSRSRAYWAFQPVARGIDYAVIRAKWEICEITDSAHRHIDGRCWLATRFIA